MPAILQLRLRSLLIVLCALPALCLLWSGCASPASQPDAVIRKSEPQLLRVPYYRGKGSALGFWYTCLQAANTKIQGQTPFMPLATMPVWAFAGGRDGGDNLPVPKSAG